MTFVIRSTNIEYLLCVKDKAVLGILCVYLGIGMAHGVREFIDPDIHGAR